MQGRPPLPESYAYDGGEVLPMSTLPYNLLVPKPAGTTARIKLICYGSSS